MGDAAKLGKLGRYAETMAKAVDLAKANPAIAKQLGPVMEKLREAFGKIPLDQLPQSMRQALEPIKTKLDVMKADNPTGRGWLKCMIRISRAGEVGADFEYDDPERWSHTPDNYKQRMQEYAAMPV